MAYDRFMLQPWRALIAGFVIATAAAPARAEAPEWPVVELRDGERNLEGTFPSTVRWLTGDGTPVTFRAVVRHRGKRPQIVLRASTPTLQQDLAISDFPKAEMFVFD